jgi:hypothetical protein
MCDIVVRNKGGNVITEWGGKPTRIGDAFGTSLWFILRQIKVEPGQSKILNIDNVSFRTGAPHELASEVYDRYLRLYKTLYADINHVNSKFRRRYNTVGNFFINTYDGIGFIKISNNYIHPLGNAATEANLSVEDYRSVVLAGIEKRGELMKTKGFQKLTGEARTLKILTEEMKGVLNGKTRISRQQSFRTTKRTTVDRNVVSYNGIGN